MRANQVIPPSPQAAALGRFGNVPINYHTGSPRIEIPLYTLAGKYISMPVVLSYDANAVTVGSLPSWTGLGWSLQAGGVITRSVQGSPDMAWNYYEWESNYVGQADPNMDFAGKNMPEQPATPPDAAGSILENNFLYEVAGGNIEIQPDVYFFSLPGYSGSFIVTRHKQIIMRDYSDWKVEANWGTVSYPANPALGFSAEAPFEIVSFTLTDPAGNRYVFGDVERTESLSDISLAEPSPSVSPPQYRYVSAWHLSSISSCDNMERIVLEHGKISEDVPGNAEPYVAPINIEANKSVTLPVSPQTQNSCCGGTLGYLSAGDGTGVGAAPHISGRRYLRSATLRIGSEGAERLVFSPSHPGTALPDAEKSSGIQLDQIKLQRRWQGEWEDAIGFFMGYDFSTGRLTLKNVQERSLATAESKPPYEFSYHSGALPETASNSIDFWGYYNGAANSILVPRVQTTAGGVWYNAGGADRKAAGDLRGTLSRIKYPAGGATELAFEGHTVEPMLNIGDKVGGFRIARLTDYTETGERASMRTFRYVEENGAPSGELLQDLKLYELASFHHFSTAGVGCQGDNTCPCQDYFCQSISIFAGGGGGLGNIQGSHIGYSRVEEIIGDAGGNIGKNVYRFDNGLKTGNLWNTRNGLLRRMEVWEGGSSPRIVKEMDYTYAYDAPCPGGGCLETTTSRIVSQKNQNNKIRLCKKASGGYEWLPLNTSGSQYYPACSEAKIFRTKFERQPYLIRTAWHRLDEVKTTEYFYEPGTPGTVQKTLAYAYSNSSLGMPTDIFFNNSDGAEFRTQVEYFSNPAIRGIPKKVQKLVGGQLAAGSDQDLDAFGRPREIYEVLRDGTTELLRISIPGYQDGRPTGAVFMGELPESYDWKNGLLERRSKGAWVWGYDYDNLRLLSSFTDIDGQETLYKYDGLLRLSEARARGGNIVTSYEYIYGSPNRVVTLTSYSDAPDQHLAEEFDGLGRPARVIHNGVAKKEYFYDPFGRMWKETYLPGSFTVYDFDDTPLERIVREIFPDGNFTQAHYGAEANHYKATAIDEKGNASSVLTDIAGRTYKTIDALGGQTTYSYVANGSPETISPPAGAPYEYEYDNRWRLTSKKVPGAAPQLFRYYDSDDLLRYSIDGNGNRLDYEYDEYKREKLVRHAKINGWDPANPNGPHGSPGSPIIENAYGEGSPQPINIGKLMWTRARLLDGSPANFVRSDFEYDPFGRVRARREQGAPTGGAGTDDYTFDYNHADWLEREARAHKGLEEFGIATRHIYDRFGREIGYTAFADQMPDGFIIGRAYDVRDQVKAKYYGSLVPFNALDRAKYRYNVRGWMTHLNDIYYGVQKYDICGEGFDAGGDTIQIEKAVDFPELIEELCLNAGNVAIEELAPCADGDCYIGLFDYQASYRTPGTEGFHGPQPLYRLGGVVANGFLVPLSYPFFYDLPSSRDLFVQELGAWLSQNGYIFESIVFEAGPNLQGNYGVRIRISGTNASFDHVIEETAGGLAGPLHPFLAFGPNYVPCPWIPGGPRGEEHEQPQSLQQALAMMAAAEPDSISYPAVLYRSRFNDSTALWMFEDELAAVRGSYRRERLLRLSSPDQSFRARYPDGTQESLSMSALLSGRAGPGRDKLEDIKPEQEPEGCNLPDLDCAPKEKLEQAASVAQIQNAMCNMYPDNYTLPLTMYLVQLCDGSTMYILGDDLLGQLEGRYLLLGQQEITSSSQLFTITVTERKPLFAMRFQEYEPNGNIKELRWKVTSRSPKYYELSYDPLNRLTAADYGHFEVPALSTPDPQKVPTQHYSVPSIGYDAVGNITGITRMGRMPAPPGA
jgi:YD repeat-containing protein